MIIGHKLFKKINLILMILLILVITSSCGSKEEKPIVTEDKDKIPEGLTSMAEKGDKVIEDVEKIMDEIKKPEQKEEQQSSQQDQSNQEGEQSGQSGGEQQDEEESQKSEQDSQQGGATEGKESTQQSISKDEKIQAMWEQLGKSVEEIHTAWNEYEIESLENGAKNEDIEKFEDALNSLTISVEGKNTLETLHHANRMNYYMSVFFDPYKGNPHGEIMRLRYFARQSYIFGLLNDWEKALESITLAENSINILRPKIKLEEEDKNLMEKLNLSLINMKSTIERKNVELLKIKRDLVLQNLKQLQEKSK